MRRERGLNAGGLKNAKQLLDALAEVVPIGHRPRLLVVVDTALDAETMLAETHETGGAYWYSPHQEVSRTVGDRGAKMEVVVLPMHTPEFLCRGYGADLVALTVAEIPHTPTGCLIYAQMMSASKWYTLNTSETWDALDPDFVALSSAFAFVNATRPNKKIL